MANDALIAAVEELISEKTGDAARVAGSRGVGGGCINNAQRIDLEDGRSYFLKSNPSPLPGMFEAEAEGLAALAAPGVIRVPHPVGAGGGEGGVPPFLVIEYIAPGSSKRGFQRAFGEQFAALHQQAQADRFGFDHDNYLGSTPQPNGWRDDWVTFWREHRLGFQLDLARRNGYADRRFNDAGDRLSDRLEDLVGEPAEPPCLLHGDLWGGNYLSDESGDAVLIDPAAYYGRREADLAMTMLFGGFDRDFYAGYNAVWPLEDGSRERLEVYKLYHLLNHLNLFGTSYLGGCMEIMRRYG